MGDVEVRNHDCRKCGRRLVDSSDLLVGLCNDDLRCAYRVITQLRADLARVTGERDEWHRQYCMASEAQASALSGESEAVRRAESAELGCEIAYRREPTQAEGDAHEYEQHESMGPVHGTGECFVPMGGWTGRRCRVCRRWVWGGPTACDACAAFEAGQERADAAEKRAEEAERECAEAWDVQGMAVARAEKAEAKLAEAEWERDAAIARAEAAEKRDATRIEGIMAQIADLERDRDHWRTVAESRPDISRENAARYIAWRSGFAPHPRNFDRLQPIDDALREHAQKAVTR